MRLLFAGILIATALTGCIEPTGPSSTAGPGPLEVYVFDDPMFGVVGQNTPYAMMARVHNPGPDSVQYTFTPLAMRIGVVGMVSDAGWHQAVYAQPAEGQVALPPQDVLAAGESRLWVWEYVEHNPANVAGVRVATNFWNFTYDRPVTAGLGPDVVPGMEVVTYTVGVWTNGTSFYTNIASMNADAAFPAGYDRAEFGGDGLPVYVYNADRTEQPPGSIDTCHFTTITGYNDLLKHQSERSTGARFLLPEEAYTRDGAEEHFLYGDALVFLNHVALIEGTVDATDSLPAPTGACFDAERYTGPVPP